MRQLVALARWISVAALSVPVTVVAGDRLDIQGLIDVRAVYADGATSFLEGGTGRLRYDPDHQGIRIGRLMLAARYRIDDTWSFNAVGGSFGDHDKYPLDFTEAWFEARPFPRGEVRYKVRIGAFQLPASLENRSVGWTSPYAISSSAINTWLGEEIRIIGTEFEAKWLGASRGYYGEVSFTAGVFGWNDPAGVLIASRGWASGDRQSTLAGGLGRPPEAYYREMDGRAGYYAGLAWRHHEQFELRALRYDNRADPGATNTDDIAWRTQFTSLGARWEPDDRWTLIVQKMQGRTYVGGDSEPEYQFAQSFRAWFALGSAQVGRERLTLRYDHFSTRQHSGFYGPPADDTGNALALALLHDFDAHWQAVGEWQQVQSRYPPRAMLGMPEVLNETQIQLSVRYRFKLQR